MERLQYKTRASSNPKGKPKVYFCCHPDDFEQYFPSISEEILGLHNCSVWYPKNLQDVRDETFLADLAQMQLFVMPVTTNLLTDSSPALVVELPFAEKKHIPVLPLVQEAGLEILFNQKCGQLQFLDKNQRDKTVMPYEKKLQTYLDTVLIGDEMSDKIRKAFDAYVFLSYRKKDRAYAQDLMRLIHQSDFCRDIAIWYDEFLVPGHDFEMAIHHALEKCELFALAVTPNLINEKNYVMDIEFPKARDIHKPILPFILVDTNLEDLKTKYPGIPACVDAYDGTGVSNAFIQTAHRIALQTKERSPEHNFFIGLAYLGGVDVEINHERAIALIEGAAREGLPEACEKLSDLYTTGMGVERSYEMAATWRETAVCQLEAIVAQNPSIENNQKLLCAVRRCGQQYMHLGYLDRAREYFEKAFALAEALEAEDSNLQAQQLLRNCYRDLGAICREIGALYDARKYLEQGYELSAAMAEAMEGEESKRDKAYGCRLLAEVYLQIGQQEYRSSGVDYPIEKAMHFCREGVATAQILSDQSGTIADKQNLAELLHLQGKINDEFEDYKASKNCYEQCRALAWQMVQEEGTPTYWHIMIDANRALSDWHMSMGENEQALVFAEENCQIAADLAEKTEMLGDNSLLADCLQQLSWLIGETDIHAGQKYCLDALNLRKQLAERTVAPQQLQDFASSCYDAMCFAGHLDQWNAAEQYSSAAKVIAECLDDGPLNARIYWWWEEVKQSFAQEFAADCCDEEKLTTKQLVEKLLDPKRSDGVNWERYTSPYQYHAELVADCPGVAELLKRPDAASVLLQRWLHQMEVLGCRLTKCLFQRQGHEHREWVSKWFRNEIANFGVAGLLLAQQAYWQQLTPQEIEQIAAYGVVCPNSKYDSSTSFPEKVVFCYDVYGTEGTLMAEYDGHVVCDKDEHLQIRSTGEGRTVVGWFDVPTEILISVKNGEETIKWERIRVTPEEDNDYWIDVVDDSTGDTVPAARFRLTEYLDHLQKKTENR